MKMGSARRFLMKNGVGPPFSVENGGSNPTPNTISGYVCCIHPDGERSDEVVVASPMNGRDTAWDGLTPRFSLSTLTGVTPIRKQWRIATNSPDLAAALENRTCHRARGFARARIEGPPTPLTRCTPSRCAKQSSRPGTRGRLKDSRFLSPLPNRTITLCGEEIPPRSTFIPLEMKLSSLIRGTHNSGFGHPVAGRLRHRHCS